MNEVFVDTSGWVSSFVRTDPHHAKASTLMTQWQKQNRRVVTTNYVLSELIALFTRFRVKRSIVLDYIKAIRSVTWVEIVHIDEVLDAAAWQLLTERLDKEWSLVDCASFIVMEKHGLTEALTADRHFEQAGFVQLLQ
jgi:predicted nucleic acid-binding protein